MKTHMVGFPDSEAPLEKIGGDECLCGLPGCQGHPVVMNGDVQTIEFTEDQYDYLLEDLQRRMRQAEPAKV